jgi:DNA-binding NtrC family response regulator
VNREDPGASPGEAESSAKPARLITLDQIEREHVAAILAQMRWHKGNACEILGISRPALDREIVKCSQGAS